jgi:hypothetical protein
MTATKRANTLHKNFHAVLEVDYQSTTLNCDHKLIITLHPRSLFTTKKSFTILVSGVFLTNGANVIKLVTGEIYIT